MQQSNYTVNINLNKTDEQKAKDKETRAKKKLRELTGKEPEQDMSLDEMQQRIDFIKTKNKQTATVKAMVIHGAVGAVKDITTTIVSEVGTRNGDVATQNKINNVMTAGKKLASSASNIASGAMMGGPWGAAIAAAIEVGKTAVEMVKNNINYQWQQKDNTLQEIRNSERLGVICSNRNR